jgi:chromosome segregation ATPase
VTSQEVEQIKRHVDEAVQGLRGEMAQVRGEMAGLRGEMAEGFAQVRGEMAAEFAQVRGEISDFRRDAAEVADHLMQEIVETRKNAGAEAEELRSQIRAVAEGVALANERLNDVDLRVDTLTGEVRRGFAGVRAELHSLHETDDELRRRIEAQEQRGA